MTIPKKLFWLPYLMLAALALPAAAATLSPSSLSLVPGEVGKVKATSIKGSLRPLTNTTPGVATAVLSGTTITVTAVSPGTTTLSVADSGSTKTVQVTVKPRMTLSAATLSMAPGQSATVTISNPAGKVLLTNSNSSKVTASISSNTIRVVAKAAGSATLTVKDGKTTLTIAVTVAAVSSGTVRGTTQGRLLASNCFQCHGTYGSGGFDKLMGSSELADELNDFLGGGEDANGIMAAHLKGYTTDQLQLIADYLANP